MLKLRRVFRIFFIGTVISIALLSMPSYAQNRNNELYVWNSYDSIGASLGFYESMGVADGGQSAVNFTQDEDDPY